MNLPEKLQNLRKEKHLSQEELADRLDISRQSVSKWESGLAMPEIDKIIMLSEMFGVTTDYLLKDSETLQSVEETEDNEKIEEIKILKRYVQNQTVVFYLGLLGLIGQVLLIYNFLHELSFKSNFPVYLGFLTGAFACLVLFVIGCIGRSFGSTKIRKLMSKAALNKILNSSYIKKYTIITNITGIAAVVMLILAIYTRNGIISMFSFLLLSVYCGYDIFSMFYKPKKLN